jgi:tetratricopeptide (TPR) repeat protein
LLLASAPPDADKAKVRPAAAAVARPAADAGEPAAARAEARRCEEEAAPEAALAACREALRLGLREPQRSAVRQLLERRLADAERWGDLVEAYQEDTALHPQDAAAWRRLGSALLYFNEDPAGARTAFEAARRLRPEDVATLVELGVSLNALGEHAAALATFDEALRLEPDAFAQRPAARAAQEASRRGEKWP